MNPETQVVLQLLFDRHLRSAVQEGSKPRDTCVRHGCGRRRSDGPAVGVMAVNKAGERLQQQVHINRFTEHAEDLHA